MLNVSIPVEKALAMRIRIDRRISHLDRTRPFREYQARNPYWCTGPSFEHFVDDRNPMRTGRCDICRQFVGFMRTKCAWRTMTRAYAANRGLYGTRRFELNHD